MTNKKCKIKSCYKLTRYKSGTLCSSHLCKLNRWGDPEYDSRAHLIATRAATRDDLNWAAGFLEGEAHFGTNSPTARCPVIKAAQVNLEPLERLREFFGGNIHKYKSRQPNAQDSYTWSVSGGRARGIIMTVYPMLSKLKTETSL